MYTKFHDSQRLYKVQILEPPPPGFHWIVGTVGPRADMDMVMK
jgi:hypothetical protein